MIYFCIAHAVISIWVFNIKVIMVIDVDTDYNI